MAKRCMGRGGHALIGAGIGAVIGGVLGGLMPQAGAEKWYLPNILLNAAVVGAVGAGVGALPKPKACAR